ncbi:hypothetical protein JVU11DRAFT_1399 [Chiua virens]|nr:hypothetical protein JVU11DRAFT_1399 [Chiua virens]
MEDAQPNEARLARKGFTAIPRVRPTRPLHRGHPYPHHSRPSNREGAHRSTTRQPLPSFPITRTKQSRERELVEVLLPKECVKGAPGCHDARTKWVEDQTHYLSTNLQLSVLSFRYTDQSVLFTCRTPQTFQSTGHHARGYYQSQFISSLTELVFSSIQTAKRPGPYPAKDHSDAKGTAITRQAPVLPSLVKPHDNQGHNAQSSEPGPSRIRSIPRAPAGSGGYFHRPNVQSLIPSLGYENKHPQSSKIEVKPHQVQITHTSPVPRRRTAVHTVPLTESIHNSTPSTATPVVQDRSGRWMSFRSGHADIYFPPSNDNPRSLSPEAGTDPRPRINETPAQILDRRREVSRVHFSHAKTTAQPSAHANDMVLARGGCEMVGSSSRRHIRHNVLEAGSSDEAPDCSAALEDEIELLPSLPDCRSLVAGFSNTSRELFLPLGSHDKPRRVLHDDIFTYVVTAHGVVDRINGTSVLKWDRNIRSPSSPFEEFVDDACILSHQEEPVIIFGHAREQDQISLLTSGRGQVNISI